MKKFTKVLSLAALASLMLGGTVTLASCGEKETTKTSEVSNNAAADAAKLIILNVNGTVVTDDFELPAKVGNDIAITWKSDDESLLTFENNGDSITAVVHRPAADSQEDTKKVTFHGEVTVDGQTASTKNFNVRIQRNMTAAEMFDNWITNAASGVTQTLKGYVISKAGFTTYKGQGEGNLIIADENDLGGYLAYQVYMTEEEYKALQPGQYVTITGATSQVYNGLIETKYGASFAVDTTKTKALSELPNKDISSMIMNSELTTEKGAATKEALKLQSTQVTLKGFTIEEIKTLPTSKGKYGTTLSTIAVVSRGGVKFDITVMEGITSFTSNDAKGLLSKLNKLGVGARIDLTGILTWSTTPSVALTTASEIKTSTEAYNDQEKAYADLTDAAKLFKQLYTKNAEVTLPATGEKGAALKYTVSGTGATIADGKLVITATTEAKEAKVTITATSGTKVLTKEITLTIQQLTDEQVVDAVIASLKDKDVESGVQTIELDTEDAKYGAQLSYASSELLVSVNGNKITYTGDTTEKQFTVTVTVTFGETSKTKDIKLVVPAGKEVDLADLTKLKDNEYYFATGYITVAPDASYGNTYIAATSGTDKTLQIYGVYGADGTAFKNLPQSTKDKWVVGAKVIVYGQYVEKYKELKNVKIVGLVVDADAIAQVKADNAAKLFTTAYDAAKEVTLPEGVTATVTSGTSAVVSGQKVTITPTATADTVKLTLTATYNDVTKTAEVEFKTQLPTATAKTATLSVNVSEIVTCDDTTNYAETLGLDPALFSVKFIKGSFDTNSKLHTGKYIQLYSTNSMEITINTGTITKLEFTFGSKEGTLKIGDETVANGSIVVSGSKLTIVSAGNGQSQIKTIKITYTE